MTDRLSIPFPQRVAERQDVLATIIDNAPIDLDGLDALLPEIPLERIRQSVQLLAGDGWVNWWQKSGRIEPTLKAVS